MEGRMRKNLMMLSLILILAFWGIHCRGSSENESSEIIVGTMDGIKNLNPYLAHTEIELALQKLVFPPLMADFIVGESGKPSENSFSGILINMNNDLNKQTGNSYLDLYLKDGYNLNPSIYVENFRLIKSLGALSSFSWNLDKIEKRKNGWWRVHFKSTFPLGKLIAASFPIIDFENAKKKLANSGKILITKDELDYLAGFSDYEYSAVNSRKKMVSLEPKKSKGGKKLIIKSFSDYATMIYNLDNNHLHAAYNISSLTGRLKIKNIIFDDMKFATQYVLFMYATKKGKKRGLENMSIINRVRREFNNSFKNEIAFKNAGGLFIRNGFLHEIIDFPTSTDDEVNLTNGNKVSVLYIKNSINDRVIAILEDIFKNMEYKFTATGIDRKTSKKNLNEEDFDFVLKSRYSLFPEFHNLRYYKDYIEKNSFHRGYLKDIDAVLLRGGKLVQLRKQAMALEGKMLRNLPIIFFIKYNTRIAVRENIQNYQSEKGVPHFFYNLSRW
jgi:hypothetical protein